MSSSKKVESKELKKQIAFFGMLDRMSNNTDNVITLLGKMAKVMEGFDQRLERLENIKRKK